MLSLKSSEPIIDLRSLSLRYLFLQSYFFALFSCEAQDNGIVIRYRARKPFKNIPEIFMVQIGIVANSNKIERIFTGEINRREENSRKLLVPAELLPDPHRRVLLDSSKAYGHHRCSELQECRGICKPF